MPLNPEAVGVGLVLGQLRSTMRTGLSFWWA